MLARAFRRLGHDVFEYAKMYERDEWLPYKEGQELQAPIVPHTSLLSGNYELHIYCEMNDPDPQYEWLRDVNAAQRVGWFFDTSYYPQHILGIARHFRFDKVF